MFKLLAIGILVAIVEGADYETLRKDLDSLDLNSEVQSFLRDNEYYSMNCGNGYSRHYREKPLDEVYSCWSSVKEAVLEVFRDSTHLSSGRRTAVSWQYVLTPTYWTFNGERRWCVSHCSEQETTVDSGFTHPPFHPSSDDLSKPIYWHERLPYNLLVGPADDIVSLNKSELLQQNPHLFTSPAPSRIKRRLSKRAIYGTTRNIKSLTDLKQEAKHEKTACQRDPFLRAMPHRCPPGCVPIEYGSSASTDPLPSVYDSSKEKYYSKPFPGSSYSSFSPEYDLSPLPSVPWHFLPNSGIPKFTTLHPGQGRPPLAPGQPGLGHLPLGPGQPGLVRPPLGSGQPGLGKPSLGPGHTSLVRPPLGSGKPGLVQPPLSSGQPGLARPTLGSRQPGLERPSLGPGQPGLVRPPLGSGQPGQGQPPQGPDKPTGHSIIGPGQPGLGQPQTHMLHPSPKNYPPNPKHSSLEVEKHDKWQFPSGQPFLNSSGNNLGRPPDNGNSPSNSSSSSNIEIVGTSPPQHMFIVMQKVIDYIKNIFS